MKRIRKTIAAGVALAFAATALPVVTPAEAGKRHWRSYHHHHYYRSPRRDNDAAVAAGIFGLAAGAILGSALSQPRYYYAPPPRAYYPAPVRYVPAPWTPEWYAYCDSKYVSFDHATGTFMGYDGIRRICQ